MNIINTTLITLFVATAGSMFASRLKVPAGTMLGAMFFVAILNITTNNAAIPSQLKILTQIIAGLFIGSSVTRHDVIALRLMIKPAVITVFIMLYFSLIVGSVIFQITPYNLATTMLASAPGGIIDMSLIGHDLGADTATISMLQLVRLLSVMGLFPFIIQHIAPLIALKQKKNTPTSNHCIRPTLAPPNGTLNKLKNIFITACISITFGLMGYILKVPAGPIVFSMIGSSLQSIFLGNMYMPSAVKNFAQISAGALIGVNVTLTSLLGLKAAIVPAVILTIGFILMTLLTSFILHKSSKLDMVTCLFACVPGGATDICLIAGDFGADTSKVIVIQLLRLICVIAFYPIIISFIQS